MVAVVAKGMSRLASVDIKAALRELEAAIMRRSKWRGRWMLYQLREAELAPILAATADPDGVEGAGQGRAGAVRACPRSAAEAWEVLRRRAAVQALAAGLGLAGVFRLPVGAK